MQQLRKLAAGAQSLCIDVQGTCTCEAELAASSEGCREVHHPELAEGQARVSEKACCTVILLCAYCCLSWVRWSSHPQHQACCMLDSQPTGEQTWHYRCSGVTPSALHHLDAVKHSNCIMLVLSHSQLLWQSTLSPFLRPSLAVCMWLC